MIRRPPRSTLDRSSAASDVYKRQFIYRDNIRKVTPEDVQRVALTYFKPDNRTIGMFLPEAKPNRAEIPNAPDIAAMVKSYKGCLLYTSPSPRDRTRSRMPSSA